MVMDVDLRVSVPKMCRSNAPALANEGILESSSLLATLSATPPTLKTAFRCIAMNDFLNLCFAFLKSFLLRVSRGGLDVRLAGLVRKLPSTGGTS